jgi:hypothetical protein
MITETMELLITFPTGEEFTLTFYVTSLDSSCSAVLGYSWLQQYNPLIDWSRNHITFQSTDHRGPAPSTSSGEAAPLQEPTLTTPNSPAEIPEIQRTPEPSTLRTSDPPSPPSISMVNVAAFLCACRLPSSQSFQLNLAKETLSGKSAAPTRDPIDLSSIPEEYHKFSNVFSKGKVETLPEHRPYDLKIDLEEGQAPSPGHMYSLSPSELGPLRTFIEDNIRSGFIRPTNSLHRAPILFVRKKDGSLRLCVDYRGLNKITKKDRYPLPLISDLLDAPRKARTYTKIDLRHAYHLVCIAEGEEWKTAFRTHYGLFEWLVMPFGLSNAPTAFQRFMNNIFSDLLDVCVIVYLNNILIYSDNMSKHKKHVKEVLCRLWKHGLYANARKCEFHRDSVKYLRYILTSDGLRMAKDKVQTILDWLELQKVKDIQSFLGFTNFYRRFIYGYSEITTPLTCLM